MDHEIIKHAFNGGSISVSRNGGQVLSWEAGGVEQLYLSPLARLGPGQSIRGGIPIIFPQFAAEGNGPRHGFARTAMWSVQEAAHDDSHSRIVLSLTDSDATRALWPHRFRLEQTITASATSLIIELAISNTDHSPWTFCAALHSYWRIAWLADSTLQGLASAPYQDRADQPLPAPTVGSPAFTGEIERLYCNAPGQIFLHDGDRIVEFMTENFSDLMVWNPGPDKAALLDDVLSGDQTTFICLEPLQLTPTLVHPTEQWLGKHCATLRPHSDHR